MSPPMSYLPLELATKILCQLPVKSLLRFRCVSKEWCSLIDSPNFIKLHLTHSIETATNLSFILAGMDDMKILSLDLPSLDNAVHFHHDHLFNTSRQYQVVGSCNGLLALCNSEEDFILWNPSTRRHQRLRKFCNDFKDDFYIYDGFGYDNVTDDYKIVRVIQVPNTKSTEVIVYSLKGNLTRVINCIDFPYYFPCAQGFGVLVGSSLYWKLSPNLYKNHLIMAFDLVDEKFHEVQLPDTMDSDCLFSMGVLGGCLYIGCNSKAHVNIWVMKKDGIKDTWTNLLKVSEIQGCEFVKGFSEIKECEFVKALAYSKSGDKVFIRRRRKGNNIYYWYDLEKERVEPVITFDDEPEDYYETVIYVGSLVNARNLMVRGEEQVE